MNVALRIQLPKLCDVFICVSYSLLELLPPLLPGCLDSLGMQNGQIPDSSITASSYYRARSAPRRARLHMALPDSVTGFTGGWCQYRRSFKYYEWLQVDFGFVASVGKVATQGKQEFDFWVTRYFLVYRRVATSGLYLYRQNGNVKVLVLLPLNNRC